MPISKNTKRKICINECGNLVLQIHKQDDEFDSYSLTEITGTEENGKYINPNRVFTVSVYMCPECGYIELYDKE